jgi:hypothetical protein
MMNEAHNGLLRSVRTREVGRRVLHAARDGGVRRFAMEALEPGFAVEANATRAVPSWPGGYLAQPEMRELIAAALELGWTLVPYECDRSQRPAGLDPMSREMSNWRENEQARNLVAALDGEPLLVWCGNHHLTKHEVGDSRPMGLRFWELSGIEPFAIDQIQSVEFGDREPYASPWVEAYAREIGAAAGFTVEDAPEGWFFTEDAFVLSTDNALS